MTEIQMHIRHFLLFLFVIAMATAPFLMGVIGVFFLIMVLYTGYGILAYRPLLRAPRQHLMSIFALAYGVWALFTLTYTTASINDVFNELHKHILLLFLPIFLISFRHYPYKQSINIGFIICMIIISLIADYRFFMLDMIENANHIFRNRIVTGFYCSFASFLCIQGYLDQLKYRWIYLVGFFILALHLIFINHALTGFVSFMGLMGLVLCQRLTIRQWGLLTLGCFILSGFVWQGYSSLSEKIFQVGSIKRHAHEWAQETQLDQPKTSLAVRILLAKQTWTMIKQAPFLGTGLSSRYTEYARYTLPRLGDGTLWRNPHNQYLLTWMELGLVGLVILLALLITQWVKTYRLSKIDRRYAQGVILALMIGCFGDIFLFLTPTLVFYIYFTGLYFSDPALPKSSHD